MPDLAFVPISSELPQNWKTLHTGANHLLAVDESSGSQPHGFLCQPPFVIAVLSQSAAPDDILRAIGHHRIHFIEHIGVTAGIIWNTQTDEFCIFRDPFGFIPWMGIPQNTGFTTSPKLQSQKCCGLALNRAWIDRFLEFRDTTSRDDLFYGTSRIRPGEMLFLTQSTPESFLDGIAAGIPHNSTTPAHPEYRDIWSRRSYTQFRASRDELTESLRKHIISAASRIPSSNPCFTLSGGLDSSGVLAAWMQNRTGIFDAVSLISRQHPSCDESRELDILEKNFSIRLHRIVMDDAWPLSEPDLYRVSGAYGPLCSPGIESSLAAYRAIEAELGPRTIITGFGGNYIVKVRTEALWRSLIHHADFRGMHAELQAMTRPQLLYLLKRIIGNLADGKIRRFMRQFRNQQRTGIHPDSPRTWLDPCFTAQFPPERTDPVFFCTHTQERAWIPLTWDWEFSVRAMDILARQTKHRFYDPLFDLELYDFCAQIPPQLFLYAGDYRTIYREALAPILPDEIIHHPKCQSFDDLMHEGMAKRARPEILRAIESFTIPDILERNHLKQAFDQYCRDAAGDGPDYPLIHLWRSLSLCLWDTPKEQPRVCQ